MTRIVREKALPFDQLVPNAETVAAMREARSSTSSPGATRVFRPPRSHHCRWRIACCYRDHPLSGTRFGFRDCHTSLR
jgi:hypothetical protein